MMVIASRVMDRHRVIVPVPLLSPRLSSHWLRLITDVDLTTARALVDSLTNEVVVRDHRLDELLGHAPMMFAEAAAKALAARWTVGRPPRSVRVPDLRSRPPCQRSSKRRRPRRRRRAVTAITIVIGTALLAATLRVPRGSAWFTALGLLVAADLDGRIASPDRSPCTRSRRGVADVRRTRRGRRRRLRRVRCRLPGRPPPAPRRPRPRQRAGHRRRRPDRPHPPHRPRQRRWRGALLPRRPHAALEPHRPAIATTIADVTVTAATGNIALVIAAAVMGTLFSLERLSTRSVLAPIVTHLTWSTLMILALPR